MNQTISRMNTTKVMKRLLLPVFAFAILLGCAKPKPAVDIWTAAGKGDIEVLKQHVAAGTDVNDQEKSRGSTPLLVAALAGQTGAARLLIEKGAKVNSRNNDGATPLLVAAFFCHADIVKLLLEKGADLNSRNNTGQTALDSVAAPWSPQLEGLYGTVAGALGISLDIDRIKRARPEMADLLRKQANH